MDVYLDRANLFSFVNSKEDYRFDDGCRLLKNQCDIKFCFSKMDLLSSVAETDEEKCNIEQVHHWIRRMTSGISGSVKYDVCIDRPLKSNIYKSFSEKQLSSVFLLHDDKISFLKDIGVMHFSDVGEELDTLSCLSFDDYQFNKLVDVQKLKSWSDLNDKISPATDIIINDRYIFSSEELIEGNCCALLEVLCHFASNVKINIVIFTLSVQDKFGQEPNWENIRNRIKKVIFNKVGEKPNVTIIKSRKNDHDRIIFTNYNYIVSGDSFNYFDCKGNLITKGSDLTISSLCYTENYDKAINFIYTKQEQINELLRLQNPSNIIGDKKSNFLKFE